MFGLLAALNSIVTEPYGRQALHYENYIRTGQGLSQTKIYRESSADRRARKELANVRSQQRVEQQVKLIRLMKKLLIQADQQTADGDIDEELEQMRNKVTELECKVERAAQKKQLDCSDMFDMKKPDDLYDRELEQMVRNASLNMPNVETLSRPTAEPSVTINDKQSHGDHVTILTPETKINAMHDHGDQCSIERIQIQKSKK